LSQKKIIFLLHFACIQQVLLKKQVKYNLFWFFSILVELDVMQTQSGQ